MAGGINVLFWQNGECNICGSSLTGSCRNPRNAQGVRKY